MLPRRFAVTAALLLNASFALAKGTPNTEVALKQATTLKSQLGPVVAAAPNARIYWPFSSDHTSEEDLIARGYAADITTAVDQALAGYTVPAGSELWFPMPHAHGEDDYGFLAATAPTIAGIATQALTFVYVDAYSPTDIVAEGGLATFVPRADGYVTYGVTLADDTTISGLTFAAGARVRFRSSPALAAPVIVEGTVTSAGNLVTGGQAIPLQAGDTVLLSPDVNGLHVTYSTPRAVGLDGVPVNDAYYELSNGTLLSGRLAETVAINGLQVAASDVSFHADGSVASAYALHGQRQTVQGITFEGSWNLLAFWPNGALAFTSAFDSDAGSSWWYFDDTATLRFHAVRANTMVLAEHRYVVNGGSEVEISDDHPLANADFFAYYPVKSILDFLAR